jgi:hypothetical protein
MIYMLLYHSLYICDIVLVISFVTFRHLINDMKMEICIFFTPNKNKRSCCGLTHTLFMAGSQSSYKVCQWLAIGRWFSSGPPISSTNETDSHDITEILLKVALNTIKQAKNKQTNKIYSALWLIWFYQEQISNMTRRVLDGKRISAQLYHLGDASCHRYQ